MFRIVPGTESELFIDSGLERTRVGLDSGTQTFSPFLITASASDRLLPFQENTWPKAAPVILLPTRVLGLP